MCLKRRNRSGYLEEQNHYSAELDPGDCWSSLVPFSGTRQIESQQNCPIYNSLYSDEITCSVAHQIPPLFFCPVLLRKTNRRVWLGERRLCLTSLLGSWAAIQNLERFSNFSAICTALFWSLATRSLQIELKFAHCSACSLETCSFQDSSSATNSNVL